MAWTQAGSLRGPQGPQGSSGRGVTSAVIDGSGHLVITYSDATTADMGNVVGAAGAPGTSVTITGSVATSSALPTGLVPADAGKGWIAADTGHLWVWSGTAFNDVGNITGPQGPQGNPGTQGPRGTTWYTGSGAPVPGDLTGALPGDLYLDVDSGVVYLLT